MRLHELTITAFGPFAGTVHVDFDELNDAGLFLMTGDTGAGKSSLLDAVCFALYGTAPGARGVKTLKSQHAQAEAVPEVRLDFTVQGRRFVVRRTPEWARAKRRGAGLLTEKASASITETTGGGERFLSSRAAEVGLLVGSLMGMSAGQFVQVALLPQGEFQTFLRASSQERHDVLQQLFRTDRFARIEDWVGDHSRRLVERAGTGRTAVQRVLDSVADRAGLSTPEDLSGDALATAAAEGRVLPWVADVLEAAVAEADAVRAEHGRARADALEARRRHDEAVRRLDVRRRRDTALRTLAELEESAAVAAAAEDAVGAHHRATGCRPVLNLLTQASAACDAARARSMSVLRTARSVRPESAPSLPSLVTASALTVLADAVRARVVRLEALVPRTEAASEARRARGVDAAHLATAEQELRAVELRTEQVPLDIDARTAALAEATALAVRHDPAAAELETARARHAAAVQVAEAQPELRRLEDVRRAARDRMQDARERQQALVARRLSGMAAELAGRLVEGSACRVCGSTDHPRPAQPAADAVTEADHRQADRELEVATAGVDAAERAVLELRRRLEGLLVAAAGLAVGEVAEQVDTLTLEVTRTLTARRDSARLEAELRVLRDEQAALARRRATAAATAAALREAIWAHDRTLAAVDAEIADTSVPGERIDTSSLAGVVLDLSTWSDVLVEAQRAFADLDAAEARRAGAVGQARSAAAAQGFASLADVGAALLPADTLGGLLGQLRERADVRARAEAVLADPDLGDPDPADGHGAAVDSEAAEGRATAAAGRLALLEDRVRSLTSMQDRLTVAMGAWAPVRDESLRAEAISRLVRGMGHDNQLQMRLSAYVLATRLDQVVSAANERLAHLRDQRYLLQRTGRAERRGSQAGLGLEVVDQWTGDVRAPATLSGGETFVVSLSLALGLADVVTHESGGTEIETLFVDEGFGTLDADTLDDVMDRLDGLRAGGRTVGVVSHVTELRSRIPVQVHVHKGRAGSTVAVRTLVG